MADFEMEISELEQFTNRLTDQKKQFPKAVKKLMRRSGSRARTIVARKARKRVRKQTGRYHKSIKRGKLWQDQGEYKIRVYSRSPYAHLIEYGHRIVGKDGKEHGFKEGNHVFEQAMKEVEQQWTKIVEEEFEKIMQKL